MKPIATMALFLFCSAVALAQQNPTYIYMYDASAADASTSYYYDNIDGVTISIPQTSADLCNTGCAYPPTYNWPSTYSTWATTSCGSALRGASSACTANIDFKSVSNRTSNSWTPSYVFSQTWANYAAQQPFNYWTANHVYPIGYTITCGVLTAPCWTPTLHYFQAIQNPVGTPAGGLCQSGNMMPTWNLTAGKTLNDGSCTWQDVLVNGTNAAPPQDVVVASDYPGSLPAWTKDTMYSPTTVIVDGLNDGHYFQEGQNLAACSSGVSGTCMSLNPPPPPNQPSWNLSGGYTCDNTCTWHDLGMKAALNVDNDTQGQVATGMPVVWETPFAYSQYLFYAAGLLNFATASQARYIRTGVGVGEEASIAGAPALENNLPIGALTDAQLKGIWTNQALQVYANNAATMKGLATPPNWVIMALINCGTSLSTSPGTDCTWADLEAQGALAQAPYYGGYGSQGLQSSDLFNQQNVAQCAIPFQGQSCCSDNWCETRHYMIGKLSYIELQELCLSYYASGTLVTCIYDPNYKNASLAEVLALATQHHTNVIELGVPEFDCAFGSACSSYSGVPAANKTAIQNASVGLPPSTSAIVGMTGLIGIGKIF